MTEYIDNFTDYIILLITTQFFFAVSNDDAGKDFGGIQITNNLKW